jgi:hypothetical protein
MLPQYALSVHQPWAHALAMGWKDIENRDWCRPNPALDFRGEFCIHASCAMTQADYAQGVAACREIGGCVMPPPADLRRGGIVGVARLVTIVRKSESPWFVGRLGLVLRDARPVDFVPAAGDRGFFQWKPADASYPPAPAKWMRTDARAPATPDLFGGAI